MKTTKEKTKSTGDFTTAVLVWISSVPFTILPLTILAILAGVGVSFIFWGHGVSWIAPATIGFAIGFWFFFQFLVFLVCLFIIKAANKQMNEDE